MEWEVGPNPEKVCHVLFLDKMTRAHGFKKMIKIVV